MAVRKEDAPALAHYRDLQDYVPAYGDYIVWSGWLTTWHGVVSSYDGDTDELSIIFAGVPFNLFTMTDTEQAKEVRKVKLDTIRSAVKGNWAVQQHDFKSNASIWFI